MTASIHTTALITGASRGLGREIARLLAQQGVRLILTARGVEALDDTAQELREHTEVLALPGDLADEDHARQLVTQGQEQFEHIDMLVNNASSIGPSPMPRLEEYPLAELEAVYRVNAITPLHLIQLVLPGMRARGEGVILNITS